MGMNPLVSIVIPHFNRLELLLETIGPIRAQDYHNWEIIVVDDGSTDQEWNALQELATDRVRVLKRMDGIKGPSRCRNLGVAESTGNFLIFVDSDDILAPWCLSKRLQGVKESPAEELWVFPVMLFNQEPGDLSVCWNRLEGDDDLQRFLRSDPPWHTSSPLWRRETFMAIGGFNEAVFYGDDADLHIKMLLKGVEYAKCQSYLPDAFIRRGNEQRITNSSSQSLLESRKARLREGTKLLREHKASPTDYGLWEGQYFVEAEFLLFNQDFSQKSISNILEDWEHDFCPTVLRKFTVKGYFRLAQATKRHLYLVLRIVRRLMKIFLPAEFFPEGGRFQSHEFEPEMFKLLENRLRG